MAKKPNKEQVVRGIGFTHEIWEQVKAYSIVENRNRSNMVCTILQRWFEADKEKNVPLKK